LDNLGYLISLQRYITMNCPVSGTVRTCAA